MISNDKELKQSFEQMERMYRALAELRNRVFPLNPRQFAVLAEGPLDEIRHLQQDIDEYSGAISAEEQDADVWIRIQGRENEIDWPDAPTSILTAFLDAFRKGIQIVAEYNSTGQLTTRPTAELKQACDLRMVGFRSGSLRMGMRLPDEPTVDSILEQNESVAYKALTEYLDLASWVDSDEPQITLEQRFADSHKRRLLLNALKPLVPRQRGKVESVEIYGRLLKNHKTIKLTRQVHRRIDEAIDQTSTTEQTRTYTGVLREIDLDNLSFMLRNVGEVEEIRCTFEEDLLENAKEALDRRVQVTGSRQVEQRRRTYAPLRVTRLEVLDDQSLEIIKEES